MKGRLRLICKFPLKLYFCNFSDKFSIPPRHGAEAVFQENALNAHNLLTIKQLVDETPAITEGQLRWWIFHWNKYDFGHVIVKIGRRVMLDRMEFSRWLDKQRLAPLPHAND